MRVRFHLAQGENYMKWQVRHDNGRVDYYDPDAVVLLMHRAVLRNNPRIAQTIHNGANKDVCAWIECVNLEVHIDLQPVGNQQIAYNPRIAPNWRNSNGDNIDGSCYQTIQSRGRTLWAE